ncbi:MAG: threonine/serine dehydratase [Chloroflexota bacterium]
MSSVAMIEAARAQIRPYMRQTRLDNSTFYSQQSQAKVFFKCENLQVTGSFKVRGALNKTLSLNDKQRGAGIVTASTGNHGAACAYAMKQVGIKGIVFVPETAVDTKVAAIERLGGKIKKFGTDGLDTELEARTFAKREGMTFISPYNDPYVMAGQGTIGVELLEQLPGLDAVFVSVGGGGLIGGIATYIKAKKPAVQIIGCSPQNSQVMAESVKAGEILDLPSLPTLSDGTAGGVEPGSITFEACQNHVDTYISVTEEEIAASMRTFMNAQHMLIEGAAGVAVAGFTQVKDQFKGKNVAIVLCGANISLAVLKSIL